MGHSTGAHFVIDSLIFPTENVLLDRDGYPVLIDFGFAKRLIETAKTFTLCGTPGYLPPECCLSRGHTFSADHWSLGILTYELVCGSASQGNEYKLCLSLSER
jgi:serine/threonine protein kinase